MMDFNGGPISPESKSGAIPARCGQSSGKTGLWRSPAARRSVHSGRQGLGCGGMAGARRRTAFCAAELSERGGVRVWAAMAG